MTCIVGVAKPGDGAVLGADSLGGDGAYWHEIATPKLYQPRSWLAFGFTTSWRFGQVLGHELELGKDRELLPAIERDPLDWVVRTLVPAMRTALSAAGYTRKKDEHEEAGTAVVAIRDRVLVVQDDYSIVEPASGVATCGYGYAVARVAAAVARDLEPAMQAADLAGLALRHAELAAPWVRGPFHFASTSMR